MGITSRLSVCSLSVQFGEHGKYRRIHCTISTPYWYIMDSRYKQFQSHVFQSYASNLCALKCPLGHQLNRESPLIMRQTEKLHNSHIIFSTMCLMATRLRDVQIDITIHWRNQLKSNELISRRCFVRKINRFHLLLSWNFSLGHRSRTGTISNSATQQRVDFFRMN